ncbi:MAG: GNAT family N-acetyltransferase [Acidimicrobiales bacterium]
MRIRPARPESAEGRKFAAYLDTAADGAFRAMLGSEMERIVAVAYVEKGHDLSFERAVFAEVDGRLVGMASGYTSDEHRASSDEPLRKAAGARMVRMLLVMAVGRSMFRFIQTVPDGDFYLQDVAVDDDHRGKGIGALLIDAMEERARQSGCRRFVLDVAEKNSGAQRLYERRGMRVEAISKRVLFLPNTRAQRMVKDL